MGFGRSFRARETGAIFWISKELWIYNLWTNKNIKKQTKTVQTNNKHTTNNLQNTNKKQPNKQSTKPSNQNVNIAQLPVRSLGISSVDSKKPWPLTWPRRRRKLCRSKAKSHASAAAVLAWTSWRCVRKKKKKKQKRYQQKTKLKSS